MNAQKIQVPGITFERLCRETAVDHIDLLKVDIEGVEYGMLSSVPEARLRSFAQLSVEFHDSLTGGEEEIVQVEQPRQAPACGGCSLWSKP